MKILLFFLAALLAFSCNSEDDLVPDTDLIGKWGLIEILADPGDGSGTFQPVESEKYVEFHSDGTITSNADLCRTFDQPGTPSSGTYSLTDSTINPDGCDPQWPYPFEHTGSTLTISYVCIEACQEKYVKL
ncbi:lipocalin family protein [Litoribacter populi]|uniref:lipocalin family protein n=1 Tax=Litoribacter populi TaxID=2598460 RepID=UPI0011804137|nr:lipocalin family protein [Litoribacter populi]